MHLKKKKTGEMGDLIIGEGFLVVRTGTVWEHYSSLAELNAEWEDMPEEPKTFFTIYYDGTISEFKVGDDEQIRDMKAIGNYFNTREEAEKATEKLKAWKRLKDKGFKFQGWDFNIADDWSCNGKIKYRAGDFTKAEIKPDLDLLFGGEE